MGGLCFPGARSIFGASPVATAFTEAALSDALDGAAARIGATPTRLQPEEVGSWARGLGVTDVVMPWSPVGWTSTMLAGMETGGVRVHRVRREWDSVCWPLARAGFFALSKRIPSLLDQFGLADGKQSRLAV